MLSYYQDEIQKNHKNQKKLDSSNQINEKKLIQICEDVAKRFSMIFGDRPLPSIIAKNILHIE
jgi:hypothetical protein